MDAESLEEDCVGCVMANLLKETDEFCPSCGVPNNKATNAALQDIYYRLRSGRQTIEPLVYTMEEYEDSYDPEFDDFTANYAMERNMVERGLCPTCGRPDLRGIKPEDIMTEEEAQEMHQMWSEQEAERRMGA